MLPQFSHVRVEFNMDFIAKHPEYFRHVAVMAQQRNRRLDDCVALGMRRGHRFFAARRQHFTVVRRQRETVVGKSLGKARPLLLANLEKAVESKLVRVVVAGNDQEPNAPRSGATCRRRISASALNQIEDLELAIIPSTMAWTSLSPLRLQTKRSPGSMVVSDIRFATSSQSPLVLAVIVRNRTSWAGARVAPRWHGRA